jgi:DNA-binding phage protein
MGPPRLVRAAWSSMKTVAPPVYTDRQACCIVLYMQSEADDTPTRLDKAGARLRTARAEQHDALIEAMYLAEVAIAEGMSEVEAARRAQVNRMTLRKHLGKQ